jgi:O-antigen/teichoic acid export membrane protein
VTFPAYSKIQNDLNRFGNAYLNVMKTITFIAIPFAGAIFIFSSDLVRLFLSEKWLAVAPLVKVLVWAGLIKAIIDATSSVFNAAGKPNINTKWQLINFFVLALLIYPFSRYWGVIGVSIAVLAGNAISAIVSIYEANKILSFEFNKLLKLISIPLLSMFASISFISWFKNFLYYEKSIELLLLIISGGLLYIILILLLDKIFNYGITTIIKESIVYLLSARS